MSSNFVLLRTKPGEFIIQLVGLPYEATPKTIQEFLYPAKIKASDITIVKKNDGTGRCNGNGFAKVRSLCDTYGLTSGMVVISRCVCCRFIQ